jgi:hypothetical protein
MDGVSTSPAGGLQDRPDAEVGLGGGRWTDPECRVGSGDVRSHLIGVRVDGGTGDAKLAAGPDHADSNLTSVGDQDRSDRAGFRAGVFAHGQLAYSGMLPCFFGGSD